jgi:DNA replication protein DnaC
MRLTTGRAYDHKKKMNKFIINKDERIIQDAVRCYREIYEEKRNKAQHVLHQENISYLNPRI